MSSYSYWQAALKGNAPTPNVDDPKPGFYRMKRNGGWIPVAVWPLTNIFSGECKLGFKFGSEVVSADLGIERWPNYCAHPITEDTYRDVAEGGKNWPDADPVVAKMIAPLPKEYATAKIDAFMGVVAAIPDIREKLHEEVEIATAGIHAYAKIETDEASVRAASLRNMLLKLASDADKARDAEKRPYLEAGRAVDDRWRDVIQSAKTAANTLRSAMEDWEQVKRKAAQEAARRQQEAREQAERENRPVPVPAPSNVPPPQSQVRPTFGKAASVGTRLEVTDVHFTKFINALVDRPEWNDFHVFMYGLAQKLANRGIILDGVTTEEKASIK